MALGTITKVSADSGLGMASAAVYLDAISFAGDGAYPTGGTAGFQAAVRAIVKRDCKVLAVVKNGPCGAYAPEYDAANDKLFVRVEATGVEVANAVDLSGTTFKVLVISA